MKTSSRPFHLVLSTGVLAVLGSCSGIAGTTDPSELPLPIPVVRASATSTTEVMLAWPRLGLSAIGEIRVERGMDSGGFAQVAVLEGDAGEYLDAGLSPSTLYRYRVRVCREVGCSGYTATQVTTLARLVIVTQALPDGLRREPYAARLNAEGGAAPTSSGDAGNAYTWSVDSGSLPAGLALSERGIISGVPETSETAVFVARVQSADGQTATREFSQRVTDLANGTQLSIVQRRLPPALEGSAFDVALRATGADDPSLTWEVVEGSLPPGLSLDDGGALWGSPTTVGAFPFRVRAASGARSAEADFALTVVQHDRSRFDITTFEVAPIPANVRPQLEAALARWERIVTGDLGDASVPRGFFGFGHCGGFGNLVNGSSVDDTVLMIDIAPIDGPGMILGMAGPCGVRSSTGLPFAGVLRLDSYDLGPLVGTDTLEDLFTHEIGHVLGFGASWSLIGLLVEGIDPRFIGGVARSQYAAIGGSHGVPVEDSGGPGTALVHWREGVFRNELMTGFAEHVGVAMPLSHVTIASMADLGYAVDWAEGETYALPGVRGTPLIVPTDPLGYDTGLPGPVRVLPEALRR